MTGIERLREFAKGCRLIGQKAYSNAIGDIADQIERELACDSDTAENVRLIVGGVVDEMERHVLGHEGMDDSPVARWARELRQALGGRDDAKDVSMSAYDLLPEEDREAIAWVREHGGLDGVKASIDKLRARLMPEGMEWLVEAWPRFEDGEPVRFLDDFERYGDENCVSAVTMYSDGSFALNFRAYSKGESFNRPAPKVLDADGVEIRVGDTVYLLPGDWCNKFPLRRCREWDAMKVINLSPNHDTGRIGCGTLSGFVVCYPYPSQLTHRAPVIASDGKPLRVGETVWDVDGNDPFTVRILPGKGDTYVVLERDGTSYYRYPEKLTHERPEIDSWERLEDDATVSPEAYCAKRGIDFSDVDGQHRVLDEVTERMARDLVRRAKALAERDA